MFSFQRYMKVTATSPLFFFCFSLCCCIESIVDKSNKQKRCPTHWHWLACSINFFARDQFQWFRLGIAWLSHKMDSVNISPPAAHKHSNHHIFIKIYRISAVWLLVSEFNNGHGRKVREVGVGQWDMRWRQTDVTLFHNSNSSTAT